MTRPRARIACLDVPLFSLAARLRSEPELKGEPVAIFEGNGNAARVIAASRPARRAGIRQGMTLPQSRAIVPKLVARGRDAESERAAQEALLEIADSFSPRVEDAGEGSVYLDLDGLPGLRPKEDVTAERAESLLGQRLIAAVEASGLPARVGIAGSKLAARVAASLPDSPKVVPEGEEARFLAPLPLDRLAPAIEIGSRLAQWGIGSIGELARLPEGEVASRLGELGRELHATARGFDPRPLEPRVPALVLSEGMDLEWPLVTLEPFLFVGHAALERLVARLESQALACTKLEVTLKLDPEGVDARGISLAAPTRDVKTLLTLLCLELEVRPPGAAVAGFSFSAHPDKPRRAQLSLFGPAALSPDRVATTIARLASMLGADRVGSPRTVDGHRPERYALASYAPPAPPEVVRAPKRGRGLLAVRALRPPIALEVLTADPVPLPAAAARTPLPLTVAAGEGRDGRAAAQAVAVSAAGNGEGRRAVVPISQTRSPRLLSIKSAPGSSLDIHGTVRVAAGPWSLEEGWWSDTPAERDYWDVELSDGGLYRIFRDRRGESWFADGLYD
ncbi:MAG: DNA polymerase Y family protein [Acidobacteria bacterium]|nr:DNA polymerase Y family protein [Acidobacteriota bacterium]